MSQDIEHMRKEIVELRKGIEALKKRFTAFDLVRTRMALEILNMRRMLEDLTRGPKE